MPRPKVFVSAFLSGGFVEWSMWETLKWGIPYGGIASTVCNNFESNLISVISAYICMCHWCGKKWIMEVVIDCWGFDAQNVVTLCRDVILLWMLSSAHDAWYMKNIFNSWSAIWTSLLIVFSSFSELIFESAGRCLNHRCLRHLGSSCSAALENLMELFTRHWLLYPTIQPGGPETRNWIFHDPWLPGQVSNRKVLSRLQYTVFFCLWPCMKPGLKINSRFEDSDMQPITL